MPKSGVYFLEVVDITAEGTTVMNPDELLAPRRRNARSEDTKMQSLAAQPQGTERR